MKVYRTEKYMLDADEIKIAIQQYMKSMYGIVINDTIVDLDASFDDKDQVSYDHTATIQVFDNKEVLPKDA